MRETCTSGSVGAPGRRRPGATRPLCDWPSIFPNATCATALIDRVIHRADVIAIEGQSYRLRDAEEQSSSRRASTSKDAGKAKKS
ncbi:ATP-binding protein [Sorangium sp. So ce117]|uniref:ATP-binding protein n=1 Tax=Sorangium sp. So ce117 TaxID=3133277 RepID=UPI003F634891